MHTYVYIFTCVGISRHVCVHASGGPMRVSETIRNCSSALLAEAEPPVENPHLRLPGRELPVGGSARWFVCGFLGMGTLNLPLAEGAH